MKNYIKKLLYYILPVLVISGYVNASDANIIKEIAAMKKDIIKLDSKIIELERTIFLAFSKYVNENLPKLNFYKDYPNKNVQERNLSEVMNKAFEHTGTRLFQLMHSTYDPRTRDTFLEKLQLDVNNLQKQLNDLENMVKELKADSK